LASPTLLRPDAHGHFVQFYKADEPLLNRNVGRFLWDGLLRGSGLLVIATPERRESLSNHLGRLGADVGGILGRRQLSMLDARETLDCFMANGVPDRERFRATITTALDQLCCRTDDGICAYGEMVGVLWEAGQHDAAILLEEYWNELLHGSGITLFCGYPIDVFGKEFRSERLQQIRCAHTHLVSGGADDSLHTAVNHAIDELLGEEAPQLRALMSAGQPATETGQAASAEGSILWLWENVPEAAEGILACARQRYQAAQPPAA